MKKGQDNVKEVRSRNPKSVIHGFLALNRQRIFALGIFWLMVIILHRVLDLAFGFKEPILGFIATIVIPLYIIAALAHNLTEYFIEKGVVEKFKRRIRYPKFIILAFTFILAYFIFETRNFLPVETLLIKLGYVGTFISGIFFTYGFTAAPATAILLIIGKQQNLIIAGLVGGLGALVGDLIIFTFIRTSFQDEIKRLENEKIILRLKKIIPNFLKKYILPIIAGFIIASPLPDEIGVSLLAILKNVQIRTFMMISYIFNTIGILVILFIGSSL